MSHVKQILGDLLSGARSEGGTREQLFGAGRFQGRLCVSSNQTWNIHLRFFLQEIHVRYINTEPVEFLALSSQTHRVLL